MANTFSVNLYPLPAPGATLQKLTVSTAAVPYAANFYDGKVKFAMELAVRFPALRDKFGWLPIWKEGGRKPLNRFFCGLSGKNERRKGWLLLKPTRQTVR